jgi:hypothetical protein
MGNYNAKGLDIWHIAFPTNPYKSNINGLSQMHKLVTRAENRL